MMFTKGDLDALMADDSPIGVSIYLPTEVRGSEIRQGPIRLKNLIARAKQELVGTGLDDAEADHLLAPGSALIADYGFWQHQDQGLALFLGNADARWYSVPQAFSEHVVVGPGFFVSPLLPLLAADGSFLVLSITADDVQIFEATRFSMALADADLPTSIEEAPGESDYENPVQASPMARPHTGSANISNAQVYGDSPPEWRKGRVVVFAQRVAAAVDHFVGTNPLPVVLVSNAEISGHFQKKSTLGPLLAGVIEANPAAMDRHDLHEAAYAIVQPLFEAARQQAVERFSVLRASNDARAVSDLEAVCSAAREGRIDTLLLVETPASGGHDDDSRSSRTRSDLNRDEEQAMLETATVQTLQLGGRVYLMPSSGPSESPATAILRF
jgi:hypothetical protein